MKTVVENLNGVWKFSDYLGAIMVRFGFGRGKYRVKPGLYSIGNPGDDSPVFVTANYKLTVDHLRRAVGKLNGWILVLDTKGVNVWCAAGKGTFGTDELINRIEKTELSEVVSHGKIIVPQLGAPGIVAHKVKKESGFRVLYGPVEAKDINEYIELGYKATDEMRRKNFPVRERLAVSLTHLSQGVKYTSGILIVFVLLDLLFQYKTGFNIWPSIITNLVISFSALLTGTIFAGILLPVLPGRAFSVKGLSIGIVFGILSYFYLVSFSNIQSVLFNIGKITLLLQWIVFQVLNLTGSSTYTSLSGVQKEMFISMPLIVSGAVTGLILVVTGGILL